MGANQSNAAFKLDGTGFADANKAEFSVFEAEGDGHLPAYLGAKAVVAQMRGAQTMERLVKAADDELRRRKMRERFLPSDFFGEGAWSMLLDLFVSEHRGRRVSTTSACLASGIPATTALRWLDMLESRGLIERTSTSRDKRVKYVMLTDRSRQALCALLQRQTSEIR